MSTGHEAVNSPEPKGIGIEFEAIAPAPPPLPGGAGSDPPAPSETSKLLVNGRGALADHSRLKIPSLGAQFESIIRTDERVRVLETKGSPWRMICSLDIRGPGGRFIGTGWMIGPRTVLTAGHCVYETSQMGGWATSITVMAGRQGAEQPFGSVEAKSFSTVREWIENEDPDFDYAVIHLNTALGDRVGWFSVAIKSDQALLDAQVNVSGYPGDKPSGTHWYHADRVLRVSQRRIFYEVDTMAGQSGAPVWIYEPDDFAKERPVAVAIHAYGVGGTPRSFGITANSAPRIIAPVLENLRNWTK